MPTTGATVAYEQAVRAIDLQAKTLDGLRTRVSALLAAASLVTTFFAGQALAKPTTENGRVVHAQIGSFGWLAIAALSLIAGCAIAILWPRRQWTFSMSATKIVNGAESAVGVPDIDDALRRDLAIWMDKHCDTNARALDRLFLWFKCACLLLTLEAIFWTVSLGT
jgi:hypothetical protein